MSENSNFRLPHSHRFFAKNGIYGYAANSWWGHPKGYLGANGVPLGKKNRPKRRKLPCPKIRIADDHAVTDFSPKMEVMVIAPKHGGDPQGSILGPMGSHWVKKWVKTVKNYHAAKFEFWTTLRSSIFLKKMEVTVTAPNEGGDTLGSILGPMGSQGPKYGSKRRKF